MNINVPFLRLVLKYFHIILFNITGKYTMKVMSNNH